MSERRVGVCHLWAQLPKGLCVELTPLTTERTMRQNLVARLYTMSAAIFRRQQLSGLFCHGLSEKKKKDMWSSSHLAASVVLSGVKTKELFLNYSPLHKKANAEVVFLWTLFFSKEKQTRLDMTLWIESKGLFLISVRFLDPRFLYMTFPPSLFLLSFIFSLMTVTLLFL